jgi:hypothetical protein
VLLNIHYNMNTKIISFYILVISMITTINITLKPLSFDQENDGDTLITVNLFSYLNMSIINNSLVVNRYNLGITNGTLDLHKYHYLINNKILGNYYYLIFSRICAIISYIFHVITGCSIYFDFLFHHVVVVNLILLILMIQSINNIMIHSINNIMDQTITYEIYLVLTLLISQIIILWRRDSKKEGLLNNE